MHGDGLHPRWRLLTVRESAPSSGGEGAADVSASVSASVQEMETSLHQLLSSTLWSYYLFAQSDSVDWTQPLITVHSQLAEAQLFEAANAAGVLGTLAQEMASYLQQQVGA